MAVSRIALLALCGGGWLAGGCADRDAVTTLHRAVEHQQADIQKLTRRLDAVEIALVSLNQRIVGGLRTSGDAPQAVATTDDAAAPADSGGAGELPARQARRAAQDYTRASLERKLIGMTPDDVTGFLGAGPAHGHRRRRLLDLRRTHRAGA